MVLFSAHQAVQASARVEVDDAPVVADVEDVLQTKRTAGVKVLHSGVLKREGKGGEGLYWFCLMTGWYTKRTAQVKVLDSGILEVWKEE